MTTKAAVMKIDLQDYPPVKTGKVRQMYDIPADGTNEEALLIVTTDRISAYDVIMPNGIPDKGRVLTHISEFWFNKIAECTPHHLITTDIDEIIKRDSRFAPAREDLAGRCMLVKKSKPIAIECIVRGYLAGSGWKEYQKSQSVCGIALPEGLKESDKLPEVIFTPSTKAEEGHDENIDEATARKIVGDAIFDEAKKRSIEIYTKASEYARERGIIICDTKFEFGVIDGELILIDEALTPDSSRFWPQEKYEAGKSQPSFDKQFVRDYLSGLDWDKTPPGPELPEEIVTKTREKYVQAYELLTGEKFGY